MLMGDHLTFTQSAFLSQRRSFNAIFVAIDQASGFVFAVPSKTTDTGSFFANNLMDCIFRMFGPCQYLKTDNCSLYRSPAVSKLCKELKIRQLFSIPYCSWSQGLIESTLGRILQILRKVIIQYPREDIYFSLSRAVWIINSMKSYRKQSPFEIMFNRQPPDIEQWAGINDAPSTFRLDEHMQKFIETHEHLRPILDKIEQLRQARNTKKGGSYIDFHQGDLVLRKDFGRLKKSIPKLSKLYEDLPYRVVQDCGPYVICEDTSAKPIAIHKHHVKKVHERKANLYKFLPPHLLRTVGFHFDRKSALQDLKEGTLAEKWYSLIHSSKYEKPASPVLTRQRLKTLGVGENLDEDELAFLQDITSNEPLNVTNDSPQPPHLPSIIEE